MSRIRAVRAGLAVALTTGVLTACAEIPNSGPTTRVGGGIESEEDLVEVDPGGPRPGASPTEVVTAFIEAMQATPLTTEFAEQFLTKDAATDWDPSREVVVYEGFETTPIGQTVDVEVQRQATLNWRGAYRAVRTDEASEVHRYLLRPEAGEWRITNPINAFYVADYTFANSYLPYSLYYFAPSADALVPYPIYLPTGDQRATSLLQGVLADPPAQQGQQPLTAVPPDTTNDGSVSITTEGIAEIGLKGGALLGLDSEQRRLLSAQLVTTVSQVSGVNGVRLLVDGAPWEIPGVPAVQDVELWRDFDPAELPSRAQLFALDAGRLVEISESVDADSNLANDVDVRRPDSQWASRDWGIRSFDVDLELKRVLAVTDDGGSLRTGRLYSAKGQTTERIYDQGTDLGPPVATRGREWLVVDRLPGGSRLLVVTKDNDVRALPFGPLRGERVSSLSLSPDGTRFAAVAQRIGRNGLEAPRVVLGQIRFAGDGTSVSGVETVHDLVTSGDELRDVNSVAWVDATTIGVLGSLNGAAVAPYTVRIDGSQLVNEWILPTELGLPRTLVPSVSSEGGVFVRSASGRLWYEADGEWEQVANRPLSSPTFPG
jgi:Lipoprotein LpqB beta-propeller domain/Sporulation and spore germination